MGKQTPLKAIRHYCLRCVNADFPWDYQGIPMGMRFFKETVRQCPYCDCPLWHYRYGKTHPRTSFEELVRQHRAKLEEQYGPDWDRPEDPTHDLGDPDPARRPPPPLRSRYQRTHGR